MQFSAILFATIVSVYDGDTFKVNLPCEMDVICKNIPVRIEHIDTPEIRSVCVDDHARAYEKILAQQAKDITQKILLPGMVITLAHPKRDKYFRLLAEVPLVTAELMKAGVAHLYEGGKKSSWCTL